MGSGGNTYEIMRRWQSMVMPNGRYDEAVAWLTARAGLSAVDVASELQVSVDVVYRLFRQFGVTVPKRACTKPYHRATDALNCLGCAETESVKWLARRANCQALEAVGERLPCEIDSRDVRPPRGDHIRHATETADGELIWEYEEFEELLAQKERVGR